MTPEVKLCHYEGSNKSRQKLRLCPAPCFILFYVTTSPFILRRVVLIANIPFAEVKLGRFNKLDESSNCVTLTKKAKLEAMKLLTFSPLHWYDNPLVLMFCDFQICVKDLLFHRDIYVPRCFRDTLYHATCPDICSSQPKKLLALI